MILFYHVRFDCTFLDKKKQFSNFFKYFLKMYVNNILIRKVFFLKLRWSLYFSKEKHFK